MANSISLEELVALNDEIAGLVRSGVPLEMGLAGWGRDLPGNLGRVVDAPGRSDRPGANRCRNRWPKQAASIPAGLSRGRRSPACARAGCPRRSNRWPPAPQSARSAPLVSAWPCSIRSCCSCWAIFSFWLLLAYVLPMLLGLYDGNPAADSGPPWPMWAAWPAAKFRFHSHRA